MKKLLLSIAYIGLYAICSAQTKHEYDRQIRFDSLSSTSITDTSGILKGKTYLNKNKNEMLNILRRLSYSVNKAIDSNDVTIWVIYQKLNPDLTETTGEVLQCVLDKNNGSEKINDYVLEKKRKRFFVVLINGEENLQLSNIKIQKEPSFFRKSLTDFFALGAGTLSPDANKKKITFVPIRIIELNPDAVKAPCNIIVSAQGLEDYELKIHELSHWSFQAGVSVNQISRNNFTLDSTTLLVTLDSADKQEWKSNLIGMLVWNPWGVDVDRIDEYDIFDHHKIGLMGGMRLSVDPIESLYAGINYSFFSGIYLNAGITWYSQLQNDQTYNISGVSNIDQALSYAKREYKPEWFIGISFSPSQMMGYLKTSK